MPIAKFQMEDGRIGRFEVPEGTTPEQAQLMIQEFVATPQTQAQQPAQPKTSMWQDVGQGVETAYSGATLGFGDELAGLGGAIVGKAANIVGLGDNKSFAEDYRTIRDKYRGDVTAFAKENPMSALGLELGGALATPVMPAVSAIRQVPTMLGKIASASGTGATYGGISGAGHAKTLEEAPMGAIGGAAMGAAAGAVAQPIMSGIGAAGSNVAQRFSGKHAENAAHVKLAEALERDVRGQSADPYLQVQARMKKLGSQATIADAAGESARGLLDTLAILPGKTKDAISNLIHERQATRGKRMVEAADTALGTMGRNASQLTKDLVAKRSAEAAPLYAQLENVAVTVDDDLLSLINATAPFHGEVQRLATMRKTPIKLTDVTIGEQIPLKHLDILKQTLFDVADAAKRAGSNTLSREAQNLRLQLTSKLDDASPKDQAGNSIYKNARDTFAGHSETINAVEVGRKALNEGADEIRDLMAGMGKSEIEAFRVGVLQSMKDKLGTQAGQTSIMKMWQEPKTSGRLKEVFGNDYRAFAAEVAKESRLKRIEGVGKGSQTASRQYGAGDLDALPIGDISSAVVNAKAGNLAGLAGSVANVWNKVKMPESTRNEIGRLLMSKDPAEIAKAEQYMLRSLGKQKARAGSVAAELGYVGGGL